MQLPSLSAGYCSLGASTRRLTAPAPDIELSIGRRKMADAKDPAQQDTPNLGQTSDPSGRDFGDSAGYGPGGAALDYHDVVGDDPITAHRPNPLDAVMRHPVPPPRAGRRRAAPDQHARPFRDLSGAVVVITGASSGI